MISILLPNTKTRKDLSEHVFNADPSNDPIHCQSRAPKILGDQFRLRRLRRKRRSQRLARLLKTAPVSFQRQQSRPMRRHALFGQIGNGVKQPVDPRPCFCRYGKVRRGRHPSRLSSPLVGEAEWGVAPAPPTSCLIRMVGATPHPVPPPQGGRGRQRYLLVLRE